MTTLLYTEKGMEETFKIWEAFGRVRREYEQWADEDKEAEEADESWGFGELEEAEEARREMNGESSNKGRRSWEKDYGASEDKIALNLRNTMYIILLL